MTENEEHGKDGKSFDGNFLTISHSAFKTFMLTNKFENQTSICF